MAVSLFKQVRQCYYCVHQTLMITNQIKSLHISLCHKLILHRRGGARGDSFPSQYRIGYGTGTQYAAAHALSLMWQGVYF